MNTGPYSPVAQLGAGPDGAAFRARGPSGAVELRLLGPAWADPPRREAILRRLRRARLAAAAAGVREILDVGLDALPPWVALAPLIGPPLTGSLKPPLDPLQAARILLALAKALGDAHRVGAVHGRLSPATVFHAAGLVQIDVSGTTILPSDGPPPGDDPAGDVAALARVGAWLLTGDEEGPLGAAPAPLRVLLEEALAPPEDRPSMPSVADRLSRVAGMFEAGRSSTAHGQERPPAAAAPHAETPAVLGRYRLLEKLGQGGMGEVYRAEDTSDGRIVAVKTLLPVWARDPLAVKRFRKEARLLEEVNNPYVANLLEVNEDGGAHYLAVEFVAGLSAGKRLDAGGAMPEAEALAVAADVCRALAAAHARGVIHRDIKPDNILLLSGQGPGGQRAKLSDFGLARHVDQTESLHLTRTGAVVGTPFYMAPEQCIGGPLGPASDVYSLGATLYHLLTGRPPFAGDTALALINHHCNTPPPSPRAVVATVSDGACRVVQRAMAKDPAHRYADAADMLGEIERLVRGEPSSVRAHPLLPACDPSAIKRWDFTWELGSSPERLWPHVSNTERLNRAIKLQAVKWETGPDDAGKVRRRGRFKVLGMETAWEEHPFEWVEGRRLGVLRKFTSGPIKWMVSEVALEPRAGGGTTLTHTIRVEPGGFLSGAAVSLEIAFRTKGNLDRVYRRIDAVVKAGRPLDDPFEEGAGLSRAQRRRLDEGVEAVARHVPAQAADALGQYLAAAPAQELARIRPLALARRLGLPEEQAVAACLHGASEGLLVLMWDLLCPLCRIPSQALDSLKSMKEHGHCEACNIDYELDFARSVEAVFRAHPSIRDVELGVYCIGGPAHSPHVVAQVRVAPGERLELPLTLGEGAYRLRGPQLPAALDARVEAGARQARWEVDLSHIQAGPPVLLRPGAQRLEVANPTREELVVRVERTADRQDALTAARAVSLALFRELFGGEVLTAGQLVSVASVTLVLTDVPGVREAAKGEGEAKAFGLLRGHLLELETLAERHGGAVVKAVGEGGLLAFQDAADAVNALLALGPGTRAAAYRGPSMAATVNGRMDYFGAGPRMLAGLIGEAPAGGWLLTQGVMDVPGVSSLLHAHGREGTMSDRSGVMVHRFGGEA